MPAAPLAAHLDAENVEFMQFAFRWMNCLLMREISVQNTIRMWDTYLVRPIILFFLAQWLKTRIYTGRGHRRVLAVPPVRLLGFPGAMEQEA